MIERGSYGRVYVQSIIGNRKRWKDLRHVFACNPLTRISDDFKETLREERDAAFSDSRLKARFLSYRLNIPSGDESTMLLSVENWASTLAREIAPAHGRQVWGIDLGANRSWSAVINLRQNGRCDAVAVAPGIPSIEAQEKRDRVPRGTYSRLVDIGVLKVAVGLRVPPVSMVTEWARAKWGFPVLAVSDRFRYDELIDAAGRWLKLEPRVTRWSEAAEDIRALRRMAADGPLSVAEDSRLLLTASLSAATVKSDDQGSTRLIISAERIIRRGTMRRRPCCWRRVNGIAAHTKVLQGGMSRNHNSLTGTRAWRRVRLLVFERDGYRCRCCGKAGRLECDHIVPLDSWKGDPLDMRQSAVACAELPYREDARGELRGAGPCRVAGITTAHGIKKRRPMVSAGACRYESAISTTG